MHRQSPKKTKHFKPKLNENVCSLISNCDPVFMTIFTPKICAHSPQASCKAGSVSVRQTSILEITKIVKNIKYRNSVGWDNIPNNILKTNVMNLAPILTNWINKSLAQVLFPLSLKRAKMLPIFKTIKTNWRLQTTDKYPSCQSSVKWMKKFIIADSTTISPQTIYYHPHNLASK